ncbi:RIO kinase 1 [Gordonia spumicola]|uniref:non-specific serine/threonine protein kinase n=1 Tax=Gordonia spumicola TaxID=589161 RepID=A0A7I9V807_9ACTN|nr:RIO1 family regulatory kinase/ATPase [Gordonia spumicola]GEE01342.1 RIO kinase 1 [Gordonia spumicola]
MTSYDEASSDADLYTFDYRPIDDPGDDQRFTRYWDVEPLQRGPQPVPGWLVTDRAALETDLGVLKTGKEADVHLLERAVPATGERCVLAAKRYRDDQHRSFRRNAGYTEGRRVRDSRVTRAVNRKSAFGREMAAGQWAHAEWESLVRCLHAGVPVPYPVQIDGTEILMELVAVDGSPAPRLAAVRPDRDLLVDWFDQLRGAMLAMSAAGFVHGDLSPYNVLAAGERLVIIDVPQMVDLIANPNGADFLQRDCTNMCDWFARRGLDVDPQELFGEVIAAAW